MKFLNEYEYSNYDINCGFIFDIVYLFVCYCCVFFILIICVYLIGNVYIC